MHILLSHQQVLQLLRCNRRQSAICFPIVLYTREQLSLLIQTGERCGDSGGCASLGHRISQTIGAGTAGRAGENKTVSYFSLCCIHSLPGSRGLFHVSLRSRIPPTSARVRVSPVSSDSIANRSSQSSTNTGAPLYI